jgi:hypothetical protein
MSDKNNEVGMTIEEILDRARWHGDTQGEDSEVDDLRDLIITMWDLMSTAQQQALRSSDAVSGLLETTDGYEAD